MSSGDLRRRKGNRIFYESLLRVQALKRYVETRKKAVPVEIAKMGPSG